MLLQLLENNILTINAFLEFRRKFHILFVGIAITALSTISYATTSLSNSVQPALMAKEKSYINALSNTQTQIPAWLIAQLLGASDHLRQFSIPQPAWPRVRLNDLLANPDLYKAKLIVVKALFAEATDVRKELQLVPPDRCWSVILLDLDYRKPIQLFTTQEPSVFKKNQLIYATGFFLTNRIDRAKENSFSKPLVVPVLTGIIIPVTGEKSFTTAAKSNKKGYTLLIPVAILVILYIALKIYLSKESKSYRGKRDGKSPAQPGG
ncbi:MAG: hypothetical protein WC975_07575 [Phycisphaerae bacterium]